jgi:hypothetical protein
VVSWCGSASLTVLRRPDQPAWVRTSSSKILMSLCDQDNGHHVLCGLAGVDLEKMSCPSSFDSLESRYPHWCPRPR